MASVQTRLREDPDDHWAIEYRFSDEETWDVLPARFNDKFRAEVAAGEWASKVLAELKAEEAGEWPKTVRGAYEDRERPEMAEVLYVVPADLARELYEALVRTHYWLTGEFPSWTKEPHDNEDRRKVEAALTRYRKEVGE